MILALGIGGMLGGVSPGARRPAEDERIEVARALPFCPPQSWYVRYWYERVEAPRPAGRLGRFAAGLARRALHPNEKRPAALFRGAA
ncbi:MAG TPA: hypothetical protein VJ770_21490 [Stellaceae bacterium]|nr:hypothetical protein [Stellaceae bacterium]